VTEKFPVGALAGIVNVTCTELLALMLRGNAGEEVMPVGRPLTATETDPENPFKPLTETVTGPTVVPTWALAEEVEAEMEKSGV